MTQVRPHSYGRKRVFESTREREETFLEKAEKAIMGESKITDLSALSSKT